MIDFTSPDIVNRIVMAGGGSLPRDPEARRKVLNRIDAMVEKDRAAFIEYAKATPDFCAWLNEIVALCPGDDDIALDYGLAYVHYFHTWLGDDSTEGHPAGHWADAFAGLVIPEEAAKQAIHMIRASLTDEQFAALAK